MGSTLSLSMGHAKVTTTLAVYAHLINTDDHTGNMAALGALSLKGWGVVRGVLSCFDLDVDSAEPTPVSRWSARSAARTNDLDDGGRVVQRMLGWSRKSMSIELCGCGATSPQ